MSPISPEDVSESPGGGSKDSHVVFELESLKVQLMEVSVVYQRKREERELNIDFSSRKRKRKQNDLREKRWTLGI